MQYNDLMDLAADIGCCLAKSGAETYRVEESVNRILCAYGVRSRVYSVPNSLFLSILTDDDTPYTRLCRIETHGTDLDAVERYNALSRRICAETPAPDVARQWLRQTKQTERSYTLSLQLLGNALAACGFAVFSGGTLRDSLCAAVCGLLLGLVSHALERVKTNTFFQKLCSAFVMALCAYSADALGLTDNVGACIIGALMLLVPGLLFTNALRDIIFGDTNSGVNRIVEVLLIAAAIALGTGAAWNVANALWQIKAAPPIAAAAPLLQCAAAVVACAGFIILFNIHGPGELLCLLGTALTWAVYCLAQSFGAGELLCSFIATLAAAAYAEIMARIRKYPAISYLVISILPLLPGAGIYYTAHYIVLGQMHTAGEYGLKTLGISGAMAVGILVVVTAVRVLHSKIMQHNAAKKNH